MPLLTKEEIIPRLARDATNSSHYVWLIAGVAFFETSNGWIFGHTLSRGTLIIALEPLVPPSHRDSLVVFRLELKKAWGEFFKCSGAKRAIFVAIESSFAESLQSLAFETLQIGTEPWVDLTKETARGNSGKGVRSARNRAVREGVSVKEMAIGEIESEPGLISAIQTMVKSRKDERFLLIDSFLNQVSPLSDGHLRRYFIAKKGKELVGLVSALPIPGKESYFLEDNIQTTEAPKGVAELLTLEALGALASTGKRASLGVVSLTLLGNGKRDSISPTLRFILQGFSKAIAFLYSSHGIEIFRKRFRPDQWKEIYVAVYTPHKKEAIKNWALSMWAVSAAFGPRLQIKWPGVKYRVRSILRRYPLTLAISLLNVVPFLVINKTGQLPEWALVRFGFSANIPLWEWPFRSVASDLFYFDRSHFFTCFGALVVVLAWAERTRKRKTLVALVLGSIFLDDIINYFVLIKPFEAIHPKLFDGLVSHRDVGSSLIVMTLLGFQMEGLKKHRETFALVAALFLCLLFLYRAPHLSHFILSMNHFLFFVIGFLVARVDREMDRRYSKSVAKQGTPVKLRPT